MRRYLRNQKGFSLIELMIVVAIIGILATVAIPNYTRFQNKAKQSEAKQALEAIFTAEKAFFAEYTEYTSRFDAIGYKPEGGNNYNTGFITDRAAANPQVPAALVGTATCISTCPGGAVPACAAAFAVAWTCNPPSNQVIAGDAITATTFTAVSIGQINGTAADTWTMTQTKTLTNTNPQID